MKDPRLRLLLGTLPDSWVLGAARCGPVGQWGRAPGTSGSIIGLLLYVGLISNLTLFGQVVLMSLFTLVAIGVCDEAERRLSKRDPGEVIIDEVIAQPLVFLGFPASLMGSWWSLGALLLGFGLFRLFDIWKPLYIGRLQSMPGGLGVVADDLAAAGAAWIVLHAVLLYLMRTGLIG